MTKQDIELTNKAYLFALDKHKGQKYGEQDFVYHLLQTYQIIKLLLPEDTELQVASFLHDCYEDTPTTKEEIIEKFSENISELIEEVTAVKRNTFPKLQSIRAVILLTASRLANMANMDDWSEEKKQEYVFKKTKYWLP